MYGLDPGRGGVVTTGSGYPDNDKPGNFRELRSHSAASGTF